MTHPNEQLAALQEKLAQTIHEAYSQDEIAQAAIAVASRTADPSSHGASQGGAVLSKEWIKGQVLAMFGQ